MGTFKGTLKDNLVARLRHIVIAATAIKSISYIRPTAIALSLTALPMITQAANYQTYVIHTYGGGALLPAVRQQLDSSPTGGTASVYQDKLILRTTAANYQAVQQLLSQIDREPQALTVAVRVGNSSSTQGSIQQSRVIITNRGLQGSGMINQHHSQQQGNSLYQVQTLSGSAASISTGTLHSLAQTYQATRYSTYNRPVGQIVIQQQVLRPTTQGISVTPRLLPNEQVEVQLTQVEEALTNANASYGQDGYTGLRVQGQTLNSTIVVPRGQWVTIGQITQNSQSQHSNYGSNRTIDTDNSAPISLMVR